MENLKSLKSEESIKNITYLTMTVFALGIIKFTHHDMKWVPLILFAIFSAAYLRKKYFFPIVILALITVLYVLTNKPAAYNFYFAILFIVIALGLGAELLEVVLKRIISLF